MVNKLQGQIAVAGLGLTGFSVVRFLSKFPVTCKVFDSNANSKYHDQLRLFFPEVEIIQGEIDSENIAASSLIVMSPGISPNAEPYCSISREKMISDIELFSWFVGAPVIAITGTNGKSTVCAMLNATLKDMGYNAALGGNFGIPALQLLDYEEIDFYVLELSSFQLELTLSIRPKVACILNIDQDHIEWHGGFDKYIQAKKRIYNNADKIIVNRHQPELHDELSTDRIFASFGLTKPVKESDFGLDVIKDTCFLMQGSNKIIAEKNLVLEGNINLQNYLACFAALNACGFNPDDFKEACLSFSGLAHRCQFVGYFGNRFWYNDSKATNSAAMLSALESLSDKHGKIVLLAGGVFKEDNLPPLPNRLNIRCAIVYGKDAKLLFDKWSGTLSCYMKTDLHTAIDHAMLVSENEDTILLSPACASYDQYESFLRRGDDFINYAKENYEKN